MQIQIKNIEHKNQVGKTSGKPFISCRLQVFSQQQNKDIWLSGFGDAMTETWSAGDTVDVDIVQNGEYYNWQKNDNTKASPDKKLALLLEINAKLDRLLGNKPVTQEIKDFAKEMNGEIDPTDNLPF